MGKIFRLSEKPSCFAATLNLIERSFGYETSHSFAVDFAPLIDESNFHNCFILLDENENVIAHIGARDRIITLGNEKFTFTMLGGIAVDESHRGEGYFQKLLQDVLAEKRSDTSFFVLWSDKEKLYNKFGFHLCGSQYELENEKVENSLFKTQYQMISSEEKKEIQKIYEKSFCKTYLTLDRGEEDWKVIEKITSADLFIKKENSKIESYYFQNKGQDLPGIIYEYGSLYELKDWLKTISHYGKVWMGSPVLETENIQYQFFMTPGDMRRFSQLVAAMTKGKILIRNINPMKQEVFFDYNEELMALDMDDFLRGIFGPGTFEELELPSFFISGLESI
jgi:predicted N-acetyltransferase YhbS